ncbi:hypothetical protein JCM10212_000585 [Sporobolomyces blumeae]
MSANPTLYASSFSSSRSPPATFHPASVRLSLTRALTTDLAAYFHERAQIEDQYVKSLHKLSSRLHGQSKDTVFRELDGFGLDQRQQDQHLGALADLRRALENDVADIARVHETWRRKVVDEVEAPLRTSVNKAEWAKWGQAERDTAGNVKEYEALVDKVQKAQAKSTKSSKNNSKLLSTQSSLSTLGSSLTSSLPAFLTQSQALDLSHAAFLKECLVKTGTLTSDLGRERMESGERLLVKVLGVDESAEAEEWALREGMAASGGRVPAGIHSEGAGLGAGATGSRRDMAEFGGAADSRSNLNAREESIADTSSLAPSTTTNSRARDRTPSRATAPPPAPLPLPTTDDSRSTREKSTLGGKLSSLIGGSKRDRSSSIPNSARYSTFGNSASPSTNTPLSNSFSEASPAAPPVPTFDRRDTDASTGSNDLLGGSSAGGQAPLAPQAPKKRDSLFPGTGGGSGSSSTGGGGGLFRRGSKLNSLDSTTNHDAGGASGSPQIGSTNSPQIGSTNSPRFDQQPVGSQFVSEPAQVDADGFSVPPAGYDRAIGEETGGGTRNLMDDDDEDERPLGDSVPKLSILPSSTLAPSSPTLPAESEADRRAALASLKNSLGAPPSSGGLGRRATARGRRSEAGAAAPDHGSGLSTPPSAMLGAGLGAGLAGGAGAAMAGLERKDTDDDVPLATIQQQQQQMPAAPTTKRREAPPPPVSANRDVPAALSPPPIPSPISPSPATAIPAPGRAMSIMSTNSSINGGLSSLHSTETLRSDPFAGMTEPGLRVSLFETVNVLMKNGDVSKVMVTGEVSVSYRPDAISSSAREPIRFRLTNYEQLEKTAPNSTYLVSGLASSSGEFTLSPAVAELNGQTVPVLKYQLRTPLASQKDLVPLVVKPTWRCEPNLTRIIVVYSQNPTVSTTASAPATSSPFGDDGDDAALSSSASIVELSDISIEVPFAGTRVATFQSKPPTGTQLASGSLSFSLPSPSPSAGAGGDKLLVSAQTEGPTPAKPSPISVRFAIKGRTVSSVGVEVVGSSEAGQAITEVRRETVAGKYLVA